MTAALGKEKVSNSKTISPNRITELRTALGIPQEKFAEMLGVSRNYVSMLERGAKEVSNDSSLGILFGVLEGNAKNFAFPQAETGGAANEGNSQNLEFAGNAESGEQRRIRVIGWAHAGQATCYEELPTDWQQTIPSDCRDPQAFAVALEGDSMEPAFREGDQLVLMPSEEAHSGCYAVCRFADDGVVFRRVEFMGDRIQLVPLNDRYYKPTHHTRAEFSWIYPIWERRSRHWK